MQKQFPVSILAGYKATPENRWQAGQWTVSAVIAGGLGQGAEVQSRRVHGDGEDCSMLWTGFSVELHKDDAESYYFNIISDRPRIFVICATDDAETLRPLIVTLSLDEAASYLESDQTVESLDMPAELYRWVEPFVLEHYLPEKKKKRKRENWKGASREQSPGH